LINVSAFQNRNEIGEHLDRNGVQYRRGKRMYFWHDNGFSGDILQLQRALGIGEHDDLTAARRRFLQVRSGFLKQRARWR
jgi:hypothetical protein